MLPQWFQVKYDPEVGVVVFDQAGEKILLGLHLK
jgi:hypothetical protein